MKRLRCLTLILVATCLVLSVQGASATPDSSLREIAKSVSPTGRIVLKEHVSVSPSEFGSRYGHLLKLTPHDELKIFSSEGVGSRETLHRMRQMHKGLEVEGAMYIVRAQSGRVLRTLGKVVGQLEIDTANPICSEEAIRIAVGSNARARLPQVKIQGSEVVGTSATLLIARTDNRLPLESKYMRLAYRVIWNDGSETRPFATYVDAHTGQVLRNTPLFTACFAEPDCLNDSCDSETETCSTELNGPRSINSLYDNTVEKYFLKDDCRGVGIHTKKYVSPSVVDVYSDEPDFDGITLETQAHWAAMKTFDYFCGKHGEYGHKLMDDAEGLIMQQLVGFTQSAYYLDKTVPGSNRVVLGAESVSYGCLDYVSIDVVAHEWTHAVADYSVDLGHEVGEPAALNEGFADIFGKMVEYMVDKQDDSENVWNKFVMFHEICGPSENHGDKRRSVSNPGTNEFDDPHAAAYRDYAWVNSHLSVSEEKYVHSGVLRRWFYLLAMGGTGRSSIDCYYDYDVEAIGPEAAGQIALYALTKGLHPTAGYADAREATIEAADELFGSTSQQRLSVIEAWNAVGVYEHLDIAPCGDKYGNETIVALYDIITCSSNTTASNVIQSGADVSYLAGSTVTLSAGFEARSGSSFRAAIETCSGSPQDYGKRLVDGQVRAAQSTGSTWTLLASIDRIVPNPIHTSADVHFNVVAPTEVSIHVIDVFGRVLSASYLGLHASGRQSVLVDMSGLTPGSYQLLLQSRNGNDVRSIVRLQ
mgnify:CR=1 FL=1